MPTADHSPEESGQAPPGSTADSLFESPAESSRLESLVNGSQQRMQEQEVLLAQSDVFERNQGFARSTKLCVHENPEISQRRAKQSVGEQHEAYRWLKPDEIAKYEGQLVGAPDEIKILLASAPISSSKFPPNEWFYRIESTVKGYLHIVFTSPIDEENGNVWYRLRFHSKTDASLEDCAPSWIIEKHYGIGEDTRKYKVASVANAHRVDGEVSFIRIGRLEGEHAGLAREISEWARTAKAILPNCDLSGKDADPVIDLTHGGGTTRVDKHRDSTFWISRDLYKLLTEIKVRERQLDQLAESGGKVVSLKGGPLAGFDPVLDAAVAEIAGKILPACHHEYTPSQEGFRLVAVMNEVDQGDRETLAGYAVQMFRPRNAVSRFDEKVKQLVVQTKDIDRVCDLLDALGDVDRPAAGRYALQLLKTRSDDYAPGRVLEFLSTSFQKAAESLTDDSLLRGALATDWQSRIASDPDRAAETFLRDCQSDSISVGQAFEIARLTLGSLVTAAGISEDSFEEIVAPFAAQNLSTGGWSWLTSYPSLVVTSLSASALFLLWHAPSSEKISVDGNVDLSSAVREVSDFLPIDLTPPPPLLKLLSVAGTFPPQLQSELESPHLSEAARADVDFCDWLAQEGGEIARILRELYHPACEPDSLAVTLGFDFEPSSPDIPGEPAAHGREVHDLVAGVIRHRAALAADATAILTLLVEHDDPNTVEDALQALVYVAENAPKIDEWYRGQESEVGGISALPVLLEAIGRDDISSHARLQAAVCLGNHGLGTVSVVKVLIAGSERDGIHQQSCEEALLELAQAEPCPATLNQYAQRALFDATFRSAVWAMAEGRHGLQLSEELLLRESQRDWRTASQISFALLEKRAADYPAPLIQAGERGTERASYRLLCVPGEVEGATTAEVSPPVRLYSEPLWLPVGSTDQSAGLPATTQKCVPVESGHELEYQFRLSDRNLSKWLLDKALKGDELEEIQELADQPERLPISWAKVDFCVEGESGDEVWDTTVINDGSFLNGEVVTIAFNLSDAQVESLLSGSFAEKVFFRVTFANTESGGPEYLTVIEVPAHWTADHIDEEATAYLALQSEVPASFAELGRRGQDLSYSLAELEAFSVLANDGDPNSTVTVENALKRARGAATGDAYFLFALEESADWVNLRQAPENADAKDETQAVRESFMRWRLEQLTRDVLAMQNQQREAVKRLAEIHQERGFPDIDVDDPDLELLREFYSDQFGWSLPDTAHQEGGPTEFAASEPTEDEQQRPNEKDRNVSNVTLVALSSAAAASAGSRRLDDAKKRYEGQKGYLRALANKQLIFAMLGDSFSVGTDFSKRLGQIDFSQAREVADVEALRMLDQSNRDQLVVEFFKELRHYQDHALRAGESESIADGELFPLILYYARRSVVDHYRYELLGKSDGRYPEGITLEDFNRQAVQTAFQAAEEGQLEARALLADALFYGADRARVELREMLERRERADLKPGEPLDKADSEAADRMDLEYQEYFSKEGGKKKFFARRHIACSLISAEIARLRKGAAVPVVGYEMISENARLVADVENLKDGNDGEDAKKFNLLAPGGAEKLLGELIVDLQHYVDSGSDMDKQDFYADVKTLPWVVNQLRRRLIDQYRYYIWATQGQRYTPKQKYEEMDKLAAQAILKGIRNATTENDRQTVRTLNLISNELGFRARHDFLTMRSLMGE